ncbi:MAG: trypsin-like peptidase domain-containing protein [Thiohalocapsa sp.]|jgi:S1-C subfamily serine protease|nr:trypsin-like peptidase domain-containing protein [Thiohalocapsa sp.]
MLAMPLAGLLAGCAPLIPPTEQGSAATAPRPAPVASPYWKANGGYPSLAPLLRRVTPAVVNVAVISEVSLEDHPFLTDPAFRQFLEQFDIEPPAPEELRRRESVGSGVIVDARRGLVLTNAHVIEDARDITVTLKDRRSFKARLIGRDPGTDVAVLRIMPLEAPDLDFADSNALEVGDFVLAIGNPFGLGQTVTSGIVSAVGRTGIADDSLGELIQTDASINPGNSGGPLIDLAGRIVGINTALIGPSGGNVGIGFSVPSNRVQRAVRRMLGER